MTGVGAAFVADAGEEIVIGEPGDARAFSCAIPVESPRAVHSESASSGADHECDWLLTEGVGFSGVRGAGNVEATRAEPKIWLPLSAFDDADESDPEAS